MRLPSLALGSLAASISILPAGCAPAKPSTAPAASAAHSAPPCTNPPKRREWRELTAPQKKSYLTAVHCLTTLPAISNLPSALNRFDDHQAVHAAQKPSIHWVGHFVLWHRYFVATYEQALRSECNYTGAQPYWDWSLDATPSDPNSTAVFSPAIFDPHRGFGGNGPKRTPTPAQNRLNITGSTGGGCVSDGPFAAPAFFVNVPERDCLRRDFVPWIMNRFADPALVTRLLEQPDYTSFARGLEGAPDFVTRNIHASGHFGIGGVLGQMGNASNSPADPLFYLHHGNLDRVFWKWQQGDLERRLHEVGGPVTPFDYGGVNVTLEFEVGMGPLAESVPLHELLNTEGGVLCYTYAE